MHFYSLCVSCLFILLAVAGDKAIAEQTSAEKSKTAKNDKPAKTSARAVKPKTLTWTDPAIAAREFPGFAFLGEYTRTKESQQSAIQIAVQGQRFYLSRYQGGLPGAGWDGSTVTHEWVGADAIKQRLEGFTRVDRSAKPGESKPPQGAIVLFDGSNTKHWAFGKSKAGLLQAGAKTKKTFTDFKLHFECLVPLKPELPLSHPDRGNSGVFALGCYEVQVCDTFGLDLDAAAWKSEELLKYPNTACGSIYGIRAADVNMNLPPLHWESFDIEFTAARFDESGKKLTAARMSVSQNGVKIHDNVSLPLGTGGGPRGPRPEVASGPIYVQSHGNPAQYRNIWILEFDPDTP